MQSHSDNKLNNEIKSLKEEIREYYREINSFYTQANVFSRFFGFYQDNARFKELELFIKKADQELQAKVAKQEAIERARTEAAHRIVSENNEEKSYSVHPVYRPVG